MGTGLAGGVVAALSALPPQALALSELLCCLPALVLLVRILWLADEEGARHGRVALVLAVGVALLALEAAAAAALRLPTAALLLLDVVLLLPALVALMGLDAWRALYLCSLSSFLTADVSLPAVIVDQVAVGNSVSEDFLAWPGVLVQWGIWALVAVPLWRLACPRLARFLGSPLVTPTNWHTLWVVPALMLACFSFARPYPVESLARRDSLVAIVLLWASLNLLLVLVFKQTANLIRMASSSLDEVRESGQADLWHEQVNHLDERIEEARRQRHDLRHHLNAVKALADEGDLAGVRAYVGELSEVVHAADYPIAYCENGLVNAALVYYADRARAAGAEVDASARVPAALPQRETAVVSVLANLLESSVAGIQAFSAVRDERPLLRVRVELRGQNLFVAVDNSCAAELVRSERGTFSTTRGPNHGLGLSSVRAAAEASDGVASFEVADDLFRASVMLGARRPGAPGARP